MTLDQLLDRLDAYDGSVPLDELVTLLGRAEICPSCVAPFTCFDPETYKRNPVRAGHAYQAYLMCWGPGQASPIHDHRGSACGIFVVQGHLVEQVYDHDDDGILRATERHELAEGAVCGSHDRDIHAVINESDTENLMTLHVYTPPMGTIGIYEADSRERSEFTYPAFEPPVTA